MLRSPPRPFLWLGLALCACLVGSLDAFARGGGPGGGGPGGGGGGGQPGMPGSRGAGPGRIAGGVGRVGDRAFGMGRFRQGNDKTAKEWESILKQSDRKKAIGERRERLMTADRHAAQEAFLSEARGGEASSACAETFLR